MYPRDFVGERVSDLLDRLHECIAHERSLTLQSRLNTARMTAIVGELGSLISDWPKSAEQIDQRAAYARDVREQHRAALKETAKP